MRSVLIAVAVAGVLSACGSGIQPMGRDTYITSATGSGFTWSGGTVKADLYRQANDFCTKEGKEMQPLAATARDASIARYATAEVQFRCLKTGDPELARPVMQQSPDTVIQIK